MQQSLDRHLFGGVCARDFFAIGGKAAASILTWYLFTRLVHHACLDQASAQVQCGPPTSEYPLLPAMLTEPNSDARSVPANEQALQKCRIARKIISLQVKTQVLLTTVAGRSSIYLKAEGSKPCSLKLFYLSL
jgi:hypothetical protein